MIDSSRIRWWINTTLTYNVTAYDDGLETMTIAGNHAAAFPSGSKFRYTQGTGDYATPVTNAAMQSDGAVYTGGNTVITIHGGFTLAGNSPHGSSGTKGIISLYPLIDLGTFARIPAPDFPMPGATFKDRKNREMRVIESGAKWFPDQFALLLDIQDMDITANDLTRLNQFINTYWRQGVYECHFFIESPLSNSQGDYTEQYALKGYPKALPGYLYGDKQMTESTSDLTFQFTCTGDGTWTDFEDFNSANYTTRD